MRNDRGYTYLVTNGMHYKIGITTGTPIKRVSELQTGSPTKIEISGYSYNSNAIDMEMELHNRFSSKRLEGEWFALDDEDVAYIHHHFENNYLDEYYAPLSEKGIEVKKKADAEYDSILMEMTKLERRSYFLQTGEYDIPRDEKFEDNKAYHQLNKTSIENIMSRMSLLKTDIQTLEKQRKAVRDKFIRKGINVAVLIIIGIFIIIMVRA